MRTTIFLIGLLSQFSSTGFAMDIVAHRGASHLAPENTLAAYFLAWELLADAAECDVHLTKDGRVVVVHDPTSGRTGAGTDHVVASSAYQVLREQDVGSWKHTRYASERIPLLSQLLVALPPKKRLLVEVKCGPEIIDPLKAVLEGSGKIDQVIIISFHLEVVVAAKRALPAVPVLYLSKSPKNKIGSYTMHDPKIVDLVLEQGLDGLGLHFAGVNEDLVAKVRKHNLLLYVWTVDDPKQAQRLELLGIDGLITNRPGWMRKQLAGDGGPKK